jgi:hypothetical protein
MRAIALATVAAAALVAVYLGLGGASYSPAAVADPCTAREWRGPDGPAEVAEQIVLSGLDGAACELGVSREDVVLAFANRDSLERFAREHGISQDELADLVRAGLLRAADDAERADRLDPRLGALFRGLAQRLPLDRLLDLLDLLPSN